MCSISIAVKYSENCASLEYYWAVVDLDIFGYHKQSSPAHTIDYVKHTYTNWKQI